MKKIILFFLLLLPCCTLLAQSHSRAKVYLDSSHTLTGLAAAGIAVDHGEYKKNTFFITDFSAAELQLMKDAGYRVELLIPDVVAHYEQQNKKKAAKATAGAGCNAGAAIEVPAHFRLGSYAGYYTYTDLLAILDTMRMLYPGLISARQPIDTIRTIEGRPIYWLRVSNRPDTEQNARPQMLVTALHHAREPGSISATVFYLWYLLENYTTDPQIKAILDNAELYFVPCVNPDGYLYNIATNPSGGGMWRKNRRVNTGGSMGVDLNRNYGYKFGYDNIGSSPSGTSDTYRGTAGFSEPETRAIKWLSEQHRFRLGVNYHTYSNVLLYPWGYIASLLTADSARYAAYGSYLTEYNHYRHGTCDQVLGYISNGDANDWMHGDTAIKKKMYSVTPEIGAPEFGFYAPETNILPDCQANLPTNLNAASLLLPYARTKTMHPKILFQPTGHFSYEFQRLGFPDTATFTATIVPLDSWITTVGSPKTYTNPAMLAQLADSISYTLAATTPNGQLVKYLLQLDNGLYTTRDTVSFYYGQKRTHYQPSTAALTDWVGSGWGVSTTSWYTAPASINSTLSGSGNYPDGSYLYLDLAQTVDLTASTEAYLEFYAKWAIETSYDFAAIEAAPEGSGTWLPLCGQYTRPGSTYQLHNEPIYDGHQPIWVKEQIDLSDYLGQKINIRFSLLSDAAGNDEGFFIDDVQLRTVQDSALAVKTLNSRADAWRIFPNPAHGSITIMPTLQQTSISQRATLYTCLGQEVRTFLVSGPTTTLSVATLPPGMYYLKIGTDVQKIVLAPVE